MICMPRGVRLVVVLALAQLRTTVTKSRPRPCLGVFHSHPRIFGLQVLQVKQVKQVSCVLSCDEATVVPMVANSVKMRGLFHHLLLSRQICLDLALELVEKLDHLTKTRPRPISTPACAA